METAKAVRGSRKERVNPSAIEAIMDGRGFSGTELAAACDPPINRSYISNILAGRRQPSADVARRLAAALKVPLAAILADPEEVAS